MSTLGKFSRRSTLALAVAASAALPARAAAPARDGQVAIRGDSDADQSDAVQKALDGARASGAPLMLPPGRIRVANLLFPASVRVIGVPGATILAAEGGPVGTAQSADGLVLDGVGFAGSGDALLAVSGSAGVRIVNCRFTGGATGLKLEDVGGTVEDCSFAGSGIALFSNNSRGLAIRGNTLAECGNGGILVWRDASGADGSIVSGNRIAGVRAGDGGSGQNGNGINIYRADNVIIADNVVSDCDFSAIRVNTGKNTSIRGNSCTNCREVAIYSEFAFSGSAIIGNIVDGASGGISITNSDQGGRLATCSGNIIRNILPSSPTNPDATPFGIGAEADTVITGNTVSDVPGIGIAAGYGAYLRNVLIAANAVSGADTGIVVSVADGIGPVRVAGNMISGAKAGAIVGMRWAEVATADLAADASKFPGVSIEGNVTAP